MIFLARRFAIMVLVLFPVCSNVFAQAPLFSAPSDSESTQALRSSRGSYTILRSRSARVDFDALEAARGALGSSLDLNLFDGLRLRARIERVRESASGGYCCLGRLEEEGGDEGTFALAVEGDVLAARIQSRREGIYEVRWQVDGTHSILQIDGDHLPQCGGGVLPVLSSPLTAARAADPAVMADSAQTVDIMVLYTADALAGAGGLNAMHAIINLGIERSNNSYANSLIDLQLHLVHVAEVSYTETGNQNTDLDNLRKKTDGALDNVHVLRDTYQADLVCLITETMTSNVTGLAYVLNDLEDHSFENFAFSVVRRDALAGLTLAHEIGHNMGCVHDRANASVTGLFSYSYGYSFTGDSGTWGTVMSYAGTEIEYFSNPNVLFDGQPTGVAVGLALEADNARTIRNSQYLVANFRTLSPVVFDQDFYTRSDTVGMSVFDLAAISMSSVVVTLSSSGGDQESVTLSATPANSGYFLGSLPSSEAAMNRNDGALQVAAGETLTAIYGVSLDTATIDGKAPLVSNVVIAPTLWDRFTVSFETDEPATVAVKGGVNLGDSTFSASGGLGMVHSVTVEGLAAASSFLFRIEATDAPGNVAIDDNGGEGYWVKTTADNLLFSDDFEGGAGTWTHAALSGSQSDWTLSSARAANGSSSWYSGGTARAAGDSALQSPAFTLPSTLESLLMTFNYWADFDKTNNPDYHPDGGIVEAQIQPAGAWTLITPEGGYPETINDPDNESAANPLLGSPGYGDDSAGFLPQIFDLSAYAGETIRVRFRIGFDSLVYSGGSEGWYVDDVAVHHGEVVPEPPVVDPNGSAAGTHHEVTFVPGKSPVRIASPTGVLRDLDSASLTSLSVTLSNRPDGTSETLWADISGTNIVLTPYDGASGVLLLSGSAPVADYQKVFRTIQYDNSSLAPDGATRVVSIVAYDGDLESAAATTDILINTDNDPPVLTTPNTQIMLMNKSLVFSAANGNALRVVDPDTGGDDIFMSLAVSQGTVRLSTLVGLTAVSGNETASVATTATLEAINLALEGATFTPPLDYSGSSSIQILVNDLGNSGLGGAMSDTGSVDILINLRNVPKTKIDSNSWVLYE